MGLASSSLTFATDKSGAARTMVLTLPATRKRFLPLPSRSIPSTPALTPLLPGSGSAWRHFDSEQPRHPTARVACTEFADLHAATRVYVVSLQGYSASGTRVEGWWEVGGRLLVQMYPLPRIMARRRSGVCWPNPIVPRGGARPSYMPPDTAQSSALRSDPGVNVFCLKELLSVRNKSRDKEAFWQAVVAATPLELERRPALSPGSRHKSQQPPAPECLGVSGWCPVTRSDG